MFQQPKSTNTPDTTNTAGAAGHAGTSDPAGTADRPDRQHPHDAISVHTLTELAMLSALALVLSWIEAMLPFQPGLPGVKLGLPNLVIVYVLYRRGARSALLVNVVRVLLASLLFSGLFGMLYSLAGAASSLLMMTLLLSVNHRREAAGKQDFFSLYGISMAGGVFHNLGQLVVAMLFVSNLNLIYYFPVMILSGIAAGILNGIAARLLLRYIPQI